MPSFCRTNISYIHTHCFHPDPIQLTELDPYSNYQTNEVLIFSCCHHKALKEDPVIGLGMRGPTAQKWMHSDPATSAAPGDTSQAKHERPLF